MRALIWSLLLLVALVGVVLPVGYLFASSKLPPLESEYDLESLLRGYIEGERMGHQSGEAGLKSLQVAWQRPEFNRLPRELVDLFLSEMGCPTFFQTPRESAPQAAWRAFNAYLLDRALPGPDGQCEFLLGVRVAEESRLTGGAQKAIAAFRIRSFLTKDQLVAYTLESYRAERGVFGVEDSAQELYRRPLKELSLAQLGELMLAVPPNPYYDDIKLCRNPLLIRQARDTVLSRAAQTGLLPEDRVGAAKRQPLACTHD